ARELGDPQRWPEIYHANQGQPVGPGHALLLNPNLIEPGWTLRLPNPTAPPNTAVPPNTVAAPGGTTPTPAPRGDGGGHHHATPIGPSPGSASPPGSGTGHPGDAPPPTAVPPPTTPPSPQTGTPAPPPPSTDAVLPPPIPAPHPPPPAPTLPGATHPATHHGPGGGINLSEGLLLAGGAAAALAGLAIAAGAHRRGRAKTTGSAAVDTPVVRHLSADLTNLEPPPPGAASGAGADTTTVAEPTPPSDRTTDHPASHANDDGAGDPRTGQRWMTVHDIAAAGGVGLTGPGALDAARGLLISTLTTDPEATAVLSTDDRRRLIGTHPHAHTTAPATPPTAGEHSSNGRVTLTATGTGVLDLLEAEMLTRVRLLDDTAGSRTPPPLLVITTVSTDTRRLQAIADLGGGLGISVLTLGGWPPGSTYHVDTTGHITHTEPRDSALTSLRIPTAAPDSVGLLALLATADTPRAAPADAPARPGLDCPASGPTTPDDAGTTVDTPVKRRVDTPAAPAPSPDTRVDTSPSVTPNLAEGEADVPGTAHRDPCGIDGGCDTALEVTTTVTPPTRARTARNTRAPSRLVAPGARLRPSATSAGRPPAASRAPTPSDVDNQPGSTGEDTPTTTPSPSPSRFIATTGGETDTARTPITITVLGALRVHWHPNPTPAAADPAGGQEITGALQPRTQELLVLLALHPDGIAREALVSALWGEHPPTRPTNTLHTALSRMRRDLAAATSGQVSDITSTGNGRYQLDPAMVRVDYWCFAGAVAARRDATTDRQRIEAYRAVVTHYGGPLAEGLSTDWIEPAREAIRRDALDAVAALARALVDADPQQTLELLELARAFDPYNELLYRDIMRLQQRLGQLDAIPRTLTLLTTRLAEINEVPTSQTRGLAIRLCQRHDDPASARSHAQDDRGRRAAR
ncbi:MAG: winged helix-turn-helix domain-containing protein, partial [Pseudonocardiales bacterium]|nr:winged helix-turn-helix domain-containing protein [Pseudonocardiales bacterium]